MLSQRILTENGNSANVNLIKKPLGSAQKSGSRMKLSALGEIQNTLHSRSTNIPNKAVTPSIKPLKTNKTTIFEDNTSSKVSAKKDKRILTDKTKPIQENLLEEEMDDFHNHALCEEADEATFTQMFSKYRFTDTEIDNLVKASSGFRFKILEDTQDDPLEDIPIPNNDVDKCFDQNELFSDFLNIDIPKPF